MWKHKNFINLQLCAGPIPYEVIVNGTTFYIQRLSDSGLTGEDTWSYNASINTDTYSISGNTVVWNDGTILQHNGVDVLPTDDIIGIVGNPGIYTTRSATPQPTLTFKHFYDAGTIGSGTVKFRHYSQQEPTPSGYADCLTFTGETSEFTLAIGSNGAKEWDGIVEYSTDHNTWTTWNGTAVSSVNKKLYLRGSGNTKFCTRKGAQLSLSARAACSGNIQTLLEYRNPPTNIPANFCFKQLFRDCTNLTQAPELPATTLMFSCYDGMFLGCANLTMAPLILPATTLTPYCYSYMFSECISLTAAPELAATILANNCCEGMFYGCTLLKFSETQSTEYPTSWRIPQYGTISSTASEWNFDMLFGTGGTFTGNPSINTTYYGAW